MDKRDEARFQFIAPLLAGWAAFLGISQRSGNILVSFRMEIAGQSWSPGVRAAVAEVERSYPYTDVSIQLARTWVDHRMKRAKQDGSKPVETVLVHELVHNVPLGAFGDLRIHKHDMDAFQNAEEHATDTITAWLMRLRPSYGFDVNGLPLLNPSQWGRAKKEGRLSWRKVTGITWKGEEDDQEEGED